MKHKIKTLVFLGTACVVLFFLAIGLTDLAESHNENKRENDIEKAKNNNVVVGVTSEGTELDEYPPAQFDINDRADLYRDINLYRVAHGKLVLLVDPYLEIASLQKSMNMISTNCWGHSCTPNQDTFYYTKQFYPEESYQMIGENLYYHNTGKADVLTSWKASDTHNKLLLDDFQLMGIGYTCGYAYQNNESSCVIVLSTLNK